MRKDRAVPSLRSPGPASGLLALVLVACILIAGCTTTQATCSEEEKVPQRGNWTEPGLFAAFPPPGIHGAWEVRWEEPAGLPVEDPTRGTVQFERLRWFGPFDGLPGAPPFFFAADGNVSGIYIETMDLAAIRTGFLDLVANVTAAQASQRAAWADAFMAGRQIYSTRWSAEHGHEVIYYLYNVRVAPPYRVADLYADLLRAHAATSGGVPDPYAQDELRLGDWWFHFPTPRREAADPGAPRTHVLSVDALDRATLRWPAPAGTDAAAFLGHANSTLDALGVPRGPMNGIELAWACP
jgi:hypothetical protein